MEKTFHISREQLKFAPMIIHNNYSKQFLSAPESIIIRLTNRCNLNCVGCYQEKDDLVDTDFLMVKNIISDASKIGVCRIQLGGGEPFLYKHIYDVIKFAYDNNIFTSICSNGTLLNNESIIKCSQSGIGHIQLSLNNPSYDDIMSNKNLPQKTQCLADNGIKYGFNVILTKYIFNNIEEIINNLLLLNPYNIKLLMVKPSEGNNDWYKKNKVDFASNNNKEKLNKILLSYECVSVDCSLGVLLQGSNGLGCLAAIRSLVILPSGRIKACPFLGKDLEVDDYFYSYKSLFDLWHNSKVLKNQRERQILKLTDYCDSIFINGECDLIERIFGME
ncbi:MAG: radical SAM protein [Bdellovibrionota bacterium]